MNNDFELEEMRQQMDMLKKKLQQQDIVNEKMMRRSMASKMSWIMKYLVIGIFAIPFVAFAVLPMVMESNVSWLFYGFTILMMIVFVGLDWYVNYVPSDFFQSNNLIDASQKLVHMKHQRKQAMILGNTVLVLWLIWLFIELWQAYQSVAAGSVQQGRIMGFMFGAAVGIMIGVPVGLHIYFKMQKTNDEILDQIEDLSKDTV